MTINSHFKLLSLLIECFRKSVKFSTRNGKRLCVRHLTSMFDHFLLFFFFFFVSAVFVSSHRCIRSNCRTCYHHHHRCSWRSSTSIQFHFVAIVDLTHIEWLMVTAEKKNIFGRCLKLQLPFQLLTDSLLSNCERLTHMRTANKSLSHIFLRFLVMLFFDDVKHRYDRLLCQHPVAWITHTRTPKAIFSIGKKPYFNAKR